AGVRPRPAPAARDQGGTRDVRACERAARGRRAVAEDHDAGGRPAAGGAPPARAGARARARAEGRPHGRAGGRPDRRRDRGARGVHPRAPRGRRRRAARRAPRRLRAPARGRRHRHRLRPGDRPRSAAGDPHEPGGARRVPRRADRGARLRVRRRGRARGGRRPDRKRRLRARRDRRARAPRMSLLEIDELSAGYGGVPVLHDVSLRIDEGQLVTVIGANGAGKTTLMRTIVGLNHPMHGSVRFDGATISKASPGSITKRGIALVPENRRVFPALAVEENLLLGAYARGADKRSMRDDRDRLYTRFPVLQERRAQLAGTLSGGEQQMLAIAMALMARPRLLMLDEPSLGLAPIIVQQVFEQIQALRETGTTILLNEQLANKAL